MTASKEATDRSACPAILDLIGQGADLFQLGEGSPRSTFLHFIAAKDLGSCIINVTAAIGANDLARLLATQNEDGETPLWAAGISGKDEIQDLLLGLGSDLEQADAGGKTFLLRMCEAGVRISVATALDAGADVKAVSWASFFWLK